MNKTAIMAELKLIISPYTEKKEALALLNEDTDFIKDLQINSANLIDIVLDVEEKFGIEIDNELLGKMLTVKATIEIIEQKLAANAG